MKSLADLIGEALASLTEVKTVSDVPAERSYKTRFEKPAASVPKAPNYHYYFCSHNVPYWQPCGKCRRDRALARRNADMVLKHLGGAAFFTK